MKSSIIFGLISAAFIFTLLPTNSVSKSLTLETSSRNLNGQSCIGKRRCLLIYVAPWCPYCHASIGAIQEIAEAWKTDPERGVSVIIGRDQPSKVEDMAAKFGDKNTFIDPDGSAWRSLGIRSIPHWTLIDPTHKVLFSHAGGVNAGGSVLKELNSY